MATEEIILDEVLDKFSIYGRYHVKLMFLIWFSYVVNTVDALQFVFTAQKSEYICRDEGFINNTCSSENGKTCSDWIYMDSHSFVAEFDLACQEWKRTLVGTIHSVGYMIGLILSGLLADRIGRKPVVVLMGFMGGILGLAKSYTYSYWLYIVLELGGAAIGDSFLNLYILQLEMVSKKNRVLFCAFCMVGDGLGSVAVPFAAWGIPYWRHFLRAIHIPSFLLTTYVFLLDESPRWLLTKGKTEKAKALVEKIAVTNKVKLDVDINKLVIEDQVELVGIGKLMKITFGSRTLLTRCLICLVWWTSCTFVSYGLMINSVFLEGNKYLNFALVEGIKLPGNFISMYILKKFDRRNPLICFFLANAVLCLLHPVFPQGYSWISLFIYVLGKLMSMLCFSIVYIYTSELFPTYTRNSMQGFCSSIGRVGSMVAPLTPLLMVYWKGLPSLFFGGTALLAGLLTFLVPDTADNCLPDTVKEAEAIGKKTEVIGINNLAMSEE